MKISTTLAVIVFAFYGVQARNCTPGLNYCGHTLLSIGKYAPQIDQCLHDNGKPSGTDGRHVLFYCAGGPNGNIKYLRTCRNACADGGAGRNDFCL